jgi:hypothetical protein
MRFSLLPATAVIALLSLVPAGCARHPTSAPHTSETSASQGPAHAAVGCDADYCPPADWNTAQASTPLPQIPPFVEPLNVVISARSTVALSAVQQALSDWRTVSAATSVSLRGIHLKCISTEKANVTGSGYLPQTAAWRLGGCVKGNDLSITGDEDHVRIWNQPVPGSKYGAWFIAASYETMCLVRDGTLQTAAANKEWAALHPGSAYHCVDGGPATFHAKHPDGYDAGATDFAAAVVAAAGGRGWHVTERVITVSRTASAGEGGVPFSDRVYLLTVTS